MSLAQAFLQQPHQAVLDAAARLPGCNVFHMFHIILSSHYIRCSSRGSKGSLDFISKLLWFGASPIALPRSRACDFLQGSLIFSIMFPQVLPAKRDRRKRLRSKARTIANVSLSNTSLFELGPSDACEIFGAKAHQQDPRHRPKTQCHHWRHGQQPFAKSSVEVKDMQQDLGTAWHSHHPGAWKKIARKQTYAVPMQFLMLLSQV